MKKEYDDYLNFVGGYGHPVSLETASYMYHFCKYNQPKSILDMGSGFSSYVFRKYASEEDFPVEIVSVDDDNYWLLQTQLFLKNQDVPYTNGMVHFDNLKVKENYYDFVFHDLSGGDKRNLTMPISAKALKSGGTIVFDDMQHLPHYQSALLVGREYNIEFVELKAETIDKIGRWAMLGEKV